MLLPFAYKVGGEEISSQLEAQIKYLFAQSYIQYSSYLLHIHTEYNRLQLMT